MKYGHVDKRTGISLDKDVYAEHFADPGDIKINYMIKFYGDTIIEEENPKKLAADLMKMGERFYILANFLNRIGMSSPSFNEPTGDK